MKVQGFTQGYRAERERVRIGTQVLAAPGLSAASPCTVWKGRLSGSKGNEAALRPLHASKDDPAAGLGA